MLAILTTGGSHKGYFALVTLRLPRMLAGILSGLAFGMAGSAFQTLLRNPLASPDMIGINAGASAAAVFGILVLKWSGLPLSILSVVLGLVTALVIYQLSSGHYFSQNRLVLIGISVQAALSALTSMLLLQASQYDVATAMRWLSGSLQTIRLVEIWPLAVAVATAGIFLMGFQRHLNLLALGDELSTALGLGAHKSRLLIIICAVILTAFATALTGPIAFVAFLSGPIAKSLVGRGEGHPLISGLMGATIIMGSDLIGQHLLATKLPVGVITGIVGAPYLLWLLVKYHKRGGIA